MMKNKGKVLVALLSVGLLIGILVYGGWQAMAEWEHARIFDEIRAGNFGAVQGLDAKQIHELEYVYKLTKENDRLVWIECDLNGDDKNELIMMESFQNGRGSTIAGIFMEKGGKCFRILWDVHDYSSCYYLVENMVIKHSADYGLGTQYCYVKHEIDSEGKMKQTKRFEILVFSEVDDIAPWFIERGFTELGTYYVVTDYREAGYTLEHEARMGKEEWMLEFDREIGNYEAVNLLIWGTMDGQKLENSKKVV